MKLDIYYSDNMILLQFAHSQCHHLKILNPQIFVFYTRIKKIPSTIFLSGVEVSTVSLFFVVGVAVVVLLVDVVALSVSSTSSVSILNSVTGLEVVVGSFLGILGVVKFRSISSQSSSSAAFAKDGAILSPYFVTHQHSLVPLMHCFSW